MFLIVCRVDLNELGFNLVCIKEWWEARNSLIGCIKRNSRLCETRMLTYLSCTSSVLWEDPEYLYISKVLQMLFISLAASGLHCITWYLSLRGTDFLVVVHGLSCSAVGGILVPWSEIEPMSAALQGRFLTTGPPGKSPSPRFWESIRMFNRLFVSL